MKYHTSFFVAATALFPATASFADVTPQEVWEQGLLTAKISGQTWVAAELEDTGDTLVAHDVTITMPGFSDILTLTGTIPQVVMKELKGGKVEITIPDAVSYDVSVSGDPKLGMEPMNITSSMTMDNAMIASGSAQELSIEMKPGTITYVTQKQVKDGVAIVPEQIITLLGVSGTSTQNTSGDEVASTWDMTADAVTALSNGTTDAMTVETSYKIAPMSMTADFKSGFDALDEPLGFIAALSGTGSYSIGNMSFEMSTGTPEQMIHVTGETEEATVGVGFDDGSLTYTGSSKNSEFVVDGSAIPFPQVDFGLEDAGFALTIPFLASETEKPFGLKLALENLRLPEIAWMMLDPTAQIAHDPATLRLDLSGDMFVGFDLINPMELISGGDTSLPAFPTDLTLNELFLSIAGATLTGNGEADFVAQDDFTSEGLPFKTAKATLSLTGGTALIDTLAQTGLVAPQMGATAKMMLGMFARPGAEPDSFITDVELNEAGKMTVNGHPMPF